MTLYVMWQDHSSVPIELSYYVQDPMTTSASAVKEYVKSIVSCAYMLESPDYTPTLEGYTFDQWYLDEAITGAAQFPMELEASKTLFGRFEPNE